MKKSIITLIAALAIPFGAHASSATETYCEKFGEMAAAITFERDRGTPKEQISLVTASLDVDAQTKIQIIELIDTIYKSDTLADASPLVIGKAVERTCLKAMN